jgi:hypothetical protein
MTFGGAVLGHWEILPPPGLTDAGRIRRFQDRTVARLKQRAHEIAEDTYRSLRAGVAATYREGEGTLYNTLQKRVIATRDGVSVEFTAGGRHLVYLTALAGEVALPSPGHFIPQSGRSKFYWSNPLYGLSPGFYTFPNKKGKPAFWRTRQGRDIIAERISIGAQQFTQSMIREHEAALVEFVQNDLAPVTRSPRVNVTQAQ